MSDIFMIAVVVIVASILAITLVLASPAFLKDVGIDEYMNNETSSNTPSIVQAPIASNNVTKAVQPPPQQSPVKTTDKPSESTTTPTKRSHYQSTYRLSPIPDYSPGCVNTPTKIGTVWWYNVFCNKLVQDD